MKINFSIIFLLLFLSSCRNLTTDKKDNNSDNDSLQILLTDKPTRDIYIKDKTQYDQTFIDGLLGYNETIQLVDDYILVGEDTAYFPKDLKLNRQTIFKGTKDNNKYILTVTRTNLTTLNYEFQLIDRDNKSIDNKSGKAVLGSLFFFGSETDEDDQDGLMYGSSEYWDKRNKCWFSIRIGIGIDENGKQRAMLNYNCKDKQNLQLDKCPTLRTE